MFRVNTPGCILDRNGRPVAYSRQPAFARGNKHTDNRGVRSFRGITLDGVDESINLGNVLNYAWTDAFSLVIRFKTTTLNNYLWAKQETAGYQPGWQINMAGGGQFAVQLCNVKANPTPPPAINRLRFNTTAGGYNDGNMHQWVLTYAGTGVIAGCAMYVDGVAAAISDSGDLLTGDFANTADCHIGRKAGASSRWLGDIDECIACTGVLSAAEVSRLWNGGTAISPYDVRLNPALRIDLWMPFDYDDSTFPTMQDRKIYGTKLNGTATNMESTDLIAGIC